MIEQYPFEILILFCCVLIAGVFLGLCRRGVIPEPVASWSLKIAGGIVSLGLLPILLARKKKNGEIESTTPIIIETRSPNHAEVVILDDRQEKAIKNSMEAIDRIEKIDVEKKSIDNGIVDDADAGSIARERLRKLQERP